MKRIFLILIIFLSWHATSLAQSCWSFECHNGQVFNVPMPLTISQRGYPDLKLTARYNSESFILPVYWNLRLGRWQGDKLWEAELIHHKLYLDNTTTEIQKFNISHGFNMFFLNRGFDRKFLRYRVGAGFILTHPESTIRGKVRGDSNEDKDLSYNLSGFALNLSSGKAFRIGNRFYFDLESKITYALAWVKVADGDAIVHNLAFHLIFGFGMAVIKK